MQENVLGILVLVSHSLSKKARTTLIFKKDQNYCDLKNMPFIWLERLKPVFGLFTEQVTCKN
jgi:hypothetical protein